MNAPSDYEWARSGDDGRGFFRRTRLWQLLCCGVAGVPARPFRPRQARPGRADRSARVVTVLFDNRTPWRQSRSRRESTASARICDRVASSSKRTHRGPAVDTGWRQL